jgi:hypothetical protein
MSHDTDAYRAMNANVTAIPSDSSLPPDTITSLEKLIDRHGIADTLIALSEICGAKAEHIATNWQDAHLAKRWATVEGAIGCIVIKAQGL